MPALAERRIISNKPPVYVQQLPSNQTKTPKKKKKGKRSKLKKQYISSSLVNLNSENTFRADTSESNSQINHLYRPMTQSIIESKTSLTKLPLLLGKSRTPTPTPSLSCQSSMSCTPRSSIGCRLPITLPLSKQPGAHERRKKLPILAAIKPENERAEKERFMRANFNYNPLFVYRFPADADVLERLGKPSDKYMKQVSFWCCYFYAQNFIPFSLTEVLPTSLSQGSLCFSKTTGYVQWFKEYWTVVTCCCVVLKVPLPILCTNGGPWCVPCIP